MRFMIPLAALLASACSDDATAPATNDTDAIHVAYFAELIQTEPGNGAAPFCISTGTWANRVDPAEDVLAKLRLLFGKVQPASACQSDLQGTTYDGALARSYHVDSITQSDSSATVEGFHPPFGLFGLDRTTRKP